VIERDGSVSNIEEIDSPSKLLTEESVRVISSSPKWTPGTQKGKPVRVYYILPIEFSLQSGGDKPIPTAATTSLIRDASQMTTEAVYILNGGPSTKEQVDALDPGSIAEIKVLKDASAKAF
jgi:hypothetical protein